MRSRKGSVTQIILHVGELLLRCGIFNKKTPRLNQIKYFLQRASLLPHSDIFLLHRLFQARSRGGVQTKTFRKGSEASSRAEGGRGYVILFSNEPSCCYVATSERRRIRLKADYHCFALRGASIRRSQRSNSEAVLFRGTLLRRTASGVRGVVITRAMLVYYCRGDTTSSVRNVAITRWHHTSFHYLCGYAQPTYLSCVGTARR